MANGMRGIQITVCPAFCRIEQCQIVHATGCSHHRSLKGCANRRHKYRELTFVYSSLLKKKLMSFQVLHKTWTDIILL